MEDVELRIKQFMSQLTDLTYRYKLELIGHGCEGVGIRPIEGEMPPGKAYDCLMVRGHIKSGERGWIPNPDISFGDYMELTEVKPVTG